MFVLNNLNILLTICLLSYSQIEKPDEVAPEIVIPIVDVTVQEGEMARFKCKIKGRPMPDIVWKFDEQPIKEGDIYKIQPGEDGECTLILPEAFPEDAGRYTVKAINPSGTVECSATLHVQGRDLH